MDFCFYMDQGSALSASIRDPKGCLDEMADDHDPNVQLLDFWFDLICFAVAAPHGSASCKTEWNGYRRRYHLYHLYLISVVWVAVFIIYHDPYPYYHSFSFLFFIISFDSTLLDLTCLFLLILSLTSLLFSLTISSLSWRLFCVVFSLHFLDSLYYILGYVMLSRLGLHQHQSRAGVRRAVV
ncbi:uncharacterized protein BDV14DRAFT_25665 [Aspergillus stella-maris]|uniref:uncharacterized protein n=1 Tax=Aspergillus stella-maris TaxID=1810926 RepID=UPI003CCD652F